LDIYLLSNVILIGYTVLLFLKYRASSNQDD
jgi:hypothetical protein